MLSQDDLGNWPLTEKKTLQLAFIGNHLVRQALVFSQLPDELEDNANVLLFGTAHRYARR